MSSAKVRFHYLPEGLRPNCRVVESLDELSTIVSQLFSPIPNRGLSALPMINQHPFGPNEMGVSPLNRLLTFSLTISPT